jgi:hypothetical protein
MSARADLIDLSVDKRLTLLVLGTTMTGAVLLIGCLRKKYKTQKMKNKSGDKVSNRIDILSDEIERSSRATRI